MDICFVFFAYSGIKWKQGEICNVSTFKKPQKEKNWFVVTQKTTLDLLWKSNLTL